MEERDLERVLAIAASLRDAPQWHRAVYAAAIASGSLRRIALVAEVVEQIAGFSVASVVAAQAELESIAVDETVQRRGIGALLLRATLREAKGLEAKEILLEVRTSNLSAAALYAKAGFEEIGRRPGYYSDPVEDAILLGFKLDDV
jgi:ribosomal-protein-alanine N-acetyltransferase